MRNRWLWLVALSLVFISTHSFALPKFITFPADIEWMTRDSAHFRVLYRKGHDEFAKRSLRIAEEKHKLLAPIFPQGPDMTWLVLADFQDSTNGYALDIPYPHIVIFAAPPEAVSQLAGLDQWLESVILHEYVHILHIYPSKGLWKIGRTIFGNVILPNGLMPTHFHEGMATFFETEFTNGGRGKGNVFRMYRRMSVNAGKWNQEGSPLDLMDGATTVWPHGASPYFFGYYLTEELWRRKNREGIYKLTDAYSSKSPPFFLSGPLHEVYDVNFDQLWTRLFEATGNEVQKEINEIKTKPLSSTAKLTDNKFNKWAVVLSPDGKKVAYRKTDPQDGGALMIWDLATRKQLDRVEIEAGPTDTICWGTKQGRQLLVFPKEVDKNHYSLNRLAGYNLDDKSSLQFQTTDEKRELTHVHRLGCSPDLSTLMVYQEAATVGYVRELKWDGKEDELKIVREWKLPQGSNVTSFLVGNTTWVALREGMTTSLWRWDDKAVKVLDVPGHVFNLRPGRKAGEILAIAGIDGRDEVWSLDVDRHEATKVISLLGGTNAFDVHDGKFVLSSYDHGGYDIVEAKPIAPVPVKLAQKKASRSAVASEERVAITEAEPYSPLSTIYPRSWIPMMLFVPNGAQFSVWIPGFDIAQRHSYNLVGGYDTRGLPFADIDYNYRFSNPMYASIGANLFPNYLIATKTIQKRWGGRAGLTLALDDLPTISLNAVFRRVERSALGPANQSVGPEIALSYQTGYKKKPMAVAPTRGTSLTLSHARYFKNLGSTDDYHETIFGVTQNLPVPFLDRHAIKLQARTSFTEGTAFFNSYSVAGGEILFSQGRGYFMNRGFYAGTFFARRLSTFNLDYQFPIARIDRGYGYLPIFFKQVTGALTADTTTIGSGFAGNETRFREDWYRVFYTSVGAEISADMTVSYYLPLHMRLGLYHGFGPQGENLYGILAVEASLF